MDATESGVVDDDVCFDEEALVQESIESIEKDLTIALESIGRNLKTVMVLEEIYVDYQAKRITEDQVKYVTFALESAMVPMTSVKNEIVLENIISRTWHLLISAVKDLSIAIRNYADSLHHMVTFFNIQGARARRLRREVSQLRNGSTTIKVGINKYMMYGNGKEVPSSIQDYGKQYKMTVAALAPVLSAVGDLAEGDLFSSLRFYRDYIFRDPEDFIFASFQALETFIKDSKKGAPFNVTDSNPLFQEFSSPPLLGMASIVLREPRDSTWKKDDVRSMIDAHRHFYGHLARRSKVQFSTMLEGSVRYDVSYKDLMPLLDASDVLISAVQKLQAPAAKLSTFAAGLESFATASYRNKDNWSEGPQGVIQGTRFYFRTCSILYDTVSSGYNFGVGNVKQALGIVEKAVGRM